MKLLFICLVLAFAQGRTATWIVTETAAFHGQVLSGVSIFLGIPFALPPVGNLRFSAPVPNPTHGVFDASHFGYSCPQGAWGDFPPIANQSEDCLTLNVFAPPGALQPGVTLPVMFFIYGGAFVIGSSAELLYWASNLALSQNAVIVTSNYRLGPFGFMAFEQQFVLGNSTGNWGLLDQQLALQWVQNNINYFGGDTSKVMLFGQSAGATSACNHLIMPSSTGLFQAAVLESGTCNAIPVATALNITDLIAERLQCDTASALDCIRSVPMNDLLAVSQMFSWSPVVDSVIIPDQPSALLQQGQFTSVPIILGVTADEGTMFVFMKFHSPLSSDLYKAELLQLIDNRVEQFDQALQLYPVVPGDNRPELANAVGDSIACTALRNARWISSSPPSNTTWFYVFAHRPNCTTYPQEWGVYTSAELPFVFDNPYPNCTFASNEQALSLAVGSYWSSLAATGTPNVNAAYPWPSFSVTSSSALILDLPISIELDYKRPQCAFWDTISKV
eukprot:TRINITY_DN10237_c0_g1_i1.p1 TRINITY_DN10237_c0_g1~~TRINITY_DN10237_c0_g1_i1.p1  ORF type:complete len:527 (-),score=68.63 TRINITY_DN10237_c0_g1_i1:75-1586(-)